jgi:hypothetical protein
MKLRRLFLIATLVGTLAAIGCGDDETTGTGGTDGTGGTGGTPGDACNTGECVNDATKKELCETAVAACMLTPVGQEACIELAIADACEL